MLIRIVVLILLIGSCIDPVKAGSPSAFADSLSVSRAGDFVNSVGVVSHFDYWSTPYNSAWPAISAALIDSGILHIRDGGMDRSPLYLSRLALLGRNGINHSAMFNVNVTADQLNSMLDVFGSYVDFVEPQNEYNASRDPNWAARLVAEQKVLYNTVHGRKAGGRSIVVLGPALNFSSYYGALGPLDQFEDAGNLHNYPCSLNPGTTKLHFGILTNHQDIKASTTYKPIWTTETGYGDNLTLTPQCGLTDDVIAKYVPRMVAERWLHGEPRMYFYQLADMPTDSRFGMLGLLRADGSPKPQFIALRSMLKLLSDGANKFPLTAQQFRVEGAPPGLRTMVVEKSDGSYYVLLWLEVESADPHTSVAINVAPANVMVAVPPTFRSAEIYTYGRGWNLDRAPVAISSERIRVAVNDQITFLKFAK
jgi:hypothetical protein